ncbi:uncharacterized protein LOC113383283 [Ctenocephalides felis]|uniref:uncharacterized protein LOC113383283 n=1 Tax=Ctenocephalides felis TaxID=7515 RepID=UPI000E6E2408|nr:uncharacterized protein LOC113383283 [Ctenocephalides felis]
MDSSDWQHVIVTHMVNPYGIWVANLSEYNTVDSTNVLLDVHLFLEKEYMEKKNSIGSTKYQIGQVIGVYYSSMKVWARGIIDDMYGDNSMLIWLTDFGYHLYKVTLPELVMPLSTEGCNIAPIMIHKLGVYGLLPAQFVPDVTFSSYEIKPCKYWLPGAVKVIEDHFKKSNGLKFLKKCDITHSDGMIQHFGRIVLILNGQDVDICEILVRHKLAIYDEKLFMEGQLIMLIDRLIPHNEKHLDIGNRMLRYDNLHEPNHLNFIMDWTKNAAKAAKKNLMAPVEDVIL